LRKEILELLDKDLEFRYAVAGYLGISEVLKRLESLSEEQVKLREEQVKLREEQKSLREEQIKLREEQIKLREDFNKMLARLGRVERTLEKLTVDVEDEAKSVIKHKLHEIGISLELTSLILPGLEINLYGASDDVCVIGEATVRAGAGLADELLGKLDRLRSDHPDRLRKKVILVIYVSLPMMDLVEKAREKNIWLLKATEEFHKPEKLFFEI
jgi:hypothetical protein